MNLSDILQKAHQDILLVDTLTTELPDLQAELTHIEQTREDILRAIGQVERHRRELRNLRGRIHNMLLHLDKLDSSLKADDQSLQFQHHLAKKGVTKVAVRPQEFTGPDRTPLPTRRMKPKPNNTESAERELQKMRAALLKNPQLLAQLQAQLVNASAVPAPSAKANS